MSEKETNRHSSEQVHDREQLNEIADKQHEAIASSLEKAEKEHQTRESEREALADATELAMNADEDKEAARPASPAERRRGAPSKKQLNKSFKAQMNTVQAEMSPGSRVISKIIHNGLIEKTSDVVGSTIAKPNAMLSGSIAAFISITVIYFIARYFGYRLSGFETIAAFVVGWIFGICYDYFSNLLRSRKP